MNSKKLALIIISFLVVSISVQSASGFFGQYRICPRCNGVGRDPATLFLTLCPKCGGDGIVGIFMDDEDLEDVLSFFGAGLFLTIVAVGITWAVVKSSRNLHQLLGFKEYEADVRGYFPNCPICGSREIKVNLIPEGRDTLSCSNCGAIWHIYIGLTGLKWAELDIEADDGRGRELLGKRMKAEEWRRMADVKRITSYGQKEKKRG
ncbi:MAG: hypothetical protein N2511_08215 [Thermodesulfovibrionales bacterium]|nr:hypothetical protein [Thermodesulfovibrionales bacterium]